MLHDPPQHSAFVVHASPDCTQNDGEFEHTLSLHRLEQHSPFVVQLFPEVLHVGLSGEHVWSEPHTPEQHSLSPLQSCASDVH
jgi:hypothetical protein